MNTSCLCNRHKVKRIVPICLFLILAMHTGCNYDEHYEILDEIEGDAAVSLNNNSENGNQRRVENNEQNLLTNGGLENWTHYPSVDTWPTGWSPPHNGYVEQDRTIVYEGGSSARMQSQETGNTARLEQLIQVYPHEMIRIRFHFYVEQWKSKGARTYCYFRTRAAEASNIPTDELESFYDKKTYYIIRGGGYGLTYFPHDLKVWQTFDETIEVPPTANYFAFGVNSYYGTTIYVDDFWIIDVSDQATTGMTAVTM